MVGFLEGEKNLFCRRLHPWSSAMPRLPSYRLWTPEEEAYLRTSFQTVSIRLMANHLGRGPRAVAHKLKALDLHADMGARAETAAQSFAQTKGGQVVARISQRHPFRFRLMCAQGHTWDSTAANLAAGKWCARCAGNARLGLMDLQSTAASRGGRLISTDYVRGSQKLEWECANGHRWRAVALSVRAGRWCPTCSSRLTERLCRAYLEHFFKKPFPPTFVDWIRGPKGRPLQLDGYNPELRVAFEFQGVQHFEYTPIFHRSREHFEERGALDDLKRKACEQHGVLLISIPYSVPYSEIGSYVRDKCEEARIRIKGPTPNYERLQFYDPRTTAELQAIAVKRGGRLISAHFEGMRRKLKWQCERGHEWTAAPMKIKAGGWCPTCRGYNQTIEEMREIARERGGDCISTRFSGTHTKLTWRCHLGHEWTATPAHVRNNRWCPVCGKRRRAEAQRHDIEEIRATIAQRGGRLISSVYVNNRTPVEVTCKHGHVWHTRASGLMKGAWCPTCAGNAKLTLEIVRKDAQARGGELLSAKYVNVQTKLDWRCGQGHVFQMNANSIRGGRWCPECARDRARRPQIAVPKADIKAMATLRSKGIGFRTIGDRFGLSATKVRALAPVRKAPRMPLAGRKGKLSYDDKERLIRLYLEGASSEMLAKKFGIGPQTVILWLRRANVTRRPRAEAQIAKRKLSEADTLQIAKQYADGMPASALATRFGVSATLIFRVLKKRGVAARRTGAPRAASNI